MVITEDSNEYELIPMSPVRRLEKRMERMENTSGGGNYPKDMLDDIVDIVRMNQMLVDELAKSNDALRIELSKLPGRLDDLIINMKELVSFIKTSGEQEVSSMSMNPETMKPVFDKLDELVQSNKKITERNDAMLELLDDVGKKMRRTQMRPRPTLNQQRPLPLRL